MIPKRILGGFTAAAAIVMTAACGAPSSSNPEESVATADHASIGKSDVYRGSASPSPSRRSGKGNASTAPATAHSDPSATATRKTSGASAAALWPTALKLSSLSTQDGEELWLSYASRDAQSALSSYRNDLAESGWQVSDTEARKGTALLEFSSENGQLIIRSTQVHLPDLKFLQHRPLDDGSQRFTFELEEDPEGGAYVKYLKRQGYSVSEVGTDYVATRGNTKFYFSFVQAGILSVDVQNIG